MLKRLGSRLSLAYRILESHWSQPATALLRIYETEIVRKNLRVTGRALDLGCGDGTLATVLLDQAGAASWCGADIDPREVKMAGGVGLYDRLYAASAEALPERPASRDLVFSNSALEHMADLERVLAEVATVLAPGGRFVFTVPSADFHRCLVWPRVVGLLGGAARKQRYLAALDRRLAHVNYLSRSQWRQALAAHGLEVRREVPYLSPRVCGWWETLANLTGGLVHLLQRGRRSPREVQLSLGIGGKPSPVLGAVALVFLLPAVLWTAIEQPPADDGDLYGALYVECVREPAPTTGAEAPTEGPAS